MNIGVQPMERLTVCFDEKDMREIKARARKRRCSEAAIVREAVAEKFDREDGADEDGRK